MDRLHFAAALATLLATACAAPPPAGLLETGRWVDLSWDFSSETIYWPTAKPFALEVVSAQETPAGYFYAANNFSAAEHGGTHLDAPIHFAEGKQTTDQIALDRLIAPAVRLDVSSLVGDSADYLLRPAAIQAWEQRHGTIPAKAIVLIHTGWGTRWPDRLRYLGTSKTGPEAVPELHFPGIDSAAARLLVQRGVRAVGIDTPSIDYGQSSTFDTHRILFAADIPGFENVAHLDQVPEVGALVVALPMKIKGGSGGPLRIVALVPAGKS